MVPESNRIQHLTSASLLAAAALVLSYLESTIPLPVTLPGVKLGLGNVAVVVALFSLGARPASSVALAKVIASGLLFGSPVMLAYSLGGTALALAGMLGLHLFAKAGPVAVSMTAAVLHNAGQIIVAALLLKNPSVFLSLAPLAVAACVTGALTGAVAAAALASLGYATPRTCTAPSEGASSFGGAIPLGQIHRLKTRFIRPAKRNGHPGVHLDDCEEKRFRCRKKPAKQQRLARNPQFNTQKSSGFGVFEAGTSLAHRLDPRTKIVFAALYLASAYLATGPAEFMLIASAAALAAALSGMSWKATRKTFKPFAWLIAFIVVFDALFMNSGDVLFRWGALCVSSGGVTFGMESALRFLCVLLATSTLMSTTSPTALTDGFAALANPLRRFGARIDDMALVMGLTLRFIPLFSEELARLRIAQSARMADFESGSFTRRVFALVPLATPLLVGTLRRGAALATSIESRAFGAAGKRTCLRKYRMQPADWAVIGFSAALAALCFAL